MDALEKAARIFKTLGDPGRLSVLQALRYQELNVSELGQTLDEDISVISHRLRALHEANLVMRRRNGSFIYYSLADEHVYQLLINAVEHSFEKNSSGETGSEHPLTEEGHLK